MRGSIVTEKQALPKLTYPWDLSWDLYSSLVPVLFSHPLTFAGVQGDPN